MKEGVPRRLGRRRTETAAALLPVLGVFLLMPPFVRVFAGDVTVFGAPLILAYLLAVWVALIVAAAQLSRGLRGRGRR